MTQGEPWEWILLAIVIVGVVILGIWLFGNPKK